MSKSIELTLSKLNCYESKEFPFTREETEKAILAALGGEVGAKKIRTKENGYSCRDSLQHPYDLLLSRHAGGEKPAIGVIVNAHSRHCRMEGCTGHRMYVRWEDGKHTYPCSKGCEAVDTGIYQIM